MSAPARVATIEHGICDGTGTRQPLSGDGVRTLYSNITDENADSIHTIILKGWTWCTEGAEIFVQSILPRLPSLHTIDASDIIAGRPESEGLRIMSILADGVVNHGKIIHVYWCDNAVGPKGVQAMASLFQASTRIQTLALQNCGISGEAAETIAEYLLADEITALRTLLLHNNMAGEKGAQAIARVIAASPELEHIQFASCRMTRAGGVALVAAMEGLTTLRHIDIHDAMGGEETTEKLIEVLPTLPALCQLNIGDIGMGNDGLEAFVPALLAAPAATQLTELHLGGNDLAEQPAGEAIAQLLVGLPKLQALYLQDNELASAATRWIAAGLLARAGGSAAEADPDTPGMQVIDLSTNYVYSGAMRDLLRAAQTAGVKRVRCDGNYMTDDVVQWGVEAGLIQGELEENDEEEAMDEADNADDADMDAVDVLAASLAAE